MKISQTKDYEVIARLNKTVQDLHYALSPEHFYEYNYEKVKNAFRVLINDNDALFLLLENDNEAIGYAWIEIRDFKGHAFKVPYKSVYVHQICIDEKKSNKGYGTVLMNRIYEIARKNEIDLVELDYWIDNTHAKEFYEKQGFIKQREFVIKNL